MSKKLKQIPASAARMCRECNNLVTTDATCPLCQKKTQPHREQKMRHGYCVDCGAGPITAKALHVVTWNEDTYLQSDDGDLTTICTRCHKAKEQESL